MTLRILFTGATGYVGGSVLSVLLKQLKQQHGREEAENAEIVALTRSHERARKLAKLDMVSPVVGDQTDLGLLERLSREADIVFALVRKSGGFKTRVAYCCVGRFKRQTRNPGYAARPQSAI
jgi:uncharacterized protein YbjT (DUF2867 family)